jgi:hypothetical protein
MSQLAINFSKERVEHLKDVIRHLYPNVTRPNAQNNSNKQLKNGINKRTDTAPHISYKEQKRRDQENGTYRGTRGAKIVRGAVVGAVAGGVVAAVASVTIIGGAAIGTVVGGVTVAVATNGE